MTVWTPPLLWAASTRSASHARRTPLLLMGRYGRSSVIRPVVCPYIQVSSTKTMRAPLDSAPASTPSTAAGNASRHCRNGGLTAL